MLSCSLHSCIHEDMRNLLGDNVNIEDIAIGCTSINHVFVIIRKLIICFVFIFGLECAVIHKHIAFRYPRCDISWVYCLTVHIEGYFFVSIGNSRKGNISMGFVYYLPGQIVFFYCGISTFESAICGYSTSATRNVEGNVYIVNLLVEDVDIDIRYLTCITSHAERYGIIATLINSYPIE